jgi:hypothetical protein
MKQIKQQQKELKTRRYYIFNEDLVNKAECIVQGRQSLNRGEYDQVEVHMHGTGDQCLGVGGKDEKGYCCKFGKGLRSCRS